VTAQWPPGRPRVLVADAWLANAGDGAIALATDARVRRLAPEASILHAAYQSDLLAEAYPELALAPPLDGMLGVGDPAPEMNGLPPDRALELVAGADAVLSQGGGFTMEHYEPWQRLRAWEIVVERGIPLAFCAQSIGPWRAARERAMLGRAFRGAVAVGVREGESAASAVELGADPDRILHGGDEAFSLFEAPPPDAEPRGLAAALTAHRPVEAEGTLRHYDIARTAAIVERLTDVAGDEGLLLISTAQGLGPRRRGLEDDSDVVAAVLERLAPESRRRVEVAEGYVAPLDFAERVSGRRALLTMRMHPAVLALSRGVPAVVIDPGFKTRGVLSEAGLGDFILDSGEPEKIAARVAELAGPESLRGRELWARLDAARGRAASNDEVVRRLLAACA
jgi:polysaccharide pyruvyl transferase WcaK-like protein